jgi:hypothetical protein
MASPTTFETAADGTPLKWANTSPITIALATINYPADAGIAPNVTPLTAQQSGLLRAAAEVWESLANLQFVFVPDTAPGATEPDIRVGLADLLHTSQPPTMSFIGYTEYNWDDNNHFLPDTVVTVQDPAQHPVSALPNSDMQYSNSSATMFQNFEQELGRALGLAQNADPTSIMNPTLSAQNPVPNAADIAAIQGLYGARTAPLAFSPVDTMFLHNLLAGTSLSTLA